MPVTTHIVDLRAEFASGNRSIFSRGLMSRMKDTLAHKKQIILFLNKRGFFSSLTCRACGFTAKCKNCDVSLTFHKESARRSYLLCHYCGSLEKVPATCPNCKSIYIRFFGIGTQKIQEDVQELFPHSRVARADRDSTRHKLGFEKIYREFKDGSIDILVGTQIIAKGLDIENVALIGVILADIGLHIPDFRAGERTFQLLTQVAGRTGRLGSSGEVVFQTYVPEQPAIRFASTADYRHFYEEEIAERKKFNYPPFSRLIKLIFVHADQKKCLAQAENVFREIQWLIKNKPELAGQVENAYLAPPSVGKMHNKYFYHILLKGSDPRRIFEHLEKRRNFKVDVDPVNIG